jgi:hypothetical protein
LPFPFTSFGAEFFSARLREGIIFRAAVILGGLPFTFDQATALQALEGNKQGTGIDTEDALADLLDADY